jgi:hypothetical protein
MNNRRPWLRMNQWELMAHVGGDYDYAQGHGWAPDWPCPHCRASLTVLTCTYTPNRWGTDSAPSNIPGDLACPHCAASVARELVRLLFKWDLPRHKGQLAEEGEDTEDEDEDGL